MGAEEDIDAALAALAALHDKWAPDAPSESPDECHDIENGLLDLVAQLKDQRHIFGKPCTLNRLLDPEEEWEIGENIYAFEGGDAEIIGMVQQEMGLVRGTTEEIDSGDDPEVVLLEQPPLTPNIFPFSFGLLSVSFVTSWTLPPPPPYDIIHILQHSVPFSFLVITFRNVL